MMSRLVVSKREEPLSLLVVRIGMIRADGLVIVPPVGGSVALAIGHTSFPPRSSGS